MDDAEILAEIWEVLKSYIPEKERQVAADHLIPLIVDMDLPDEDFQAFIRSDSFLEEAATEFLDLDSESDPDDEGDWR